MFTPHLMPDVNSFLLSAVVAVLAWTGNRMIRSVDSMQKVVASLAERVARIEGHLGVESNGNAS